MWKRILIPFGISLVTLVGLGVFVGREGIPYEALYTVHLGWFALAALKLPLLFPLWVIRWRVILQARKQSVSIRAVAIGVLVRSFFNNITPGVGTGGEVAGAYYLSRREGIPFREAVASTAVERMVMGLVLVVLIAVVLGVTLPLLPLSSPVVRLTLIGLGGFAFIVGLALYLSVVRFLYAKRVIKGFVRAIAWFIPSWRRRVANYDLDGMLDEFGVAYQSAVKNRRVIGTVALATLFQSGLEILQPYALFRALGVAIPFWIVLVNIAILKVLGTFSFIPGGSGIVEGGNFAIYQVLSPVPQAVIVTQTALFRVLDAWVLWLVGGVVTSVVSATLASAPGASRGKGV